MHVCNKMIVFIILKVYVVSWTSIYVPAMLHAVDAVDAVVVVVRYTF